MPIPEPVVKSCLFISDVSCYDVAKDFIGPFVTILIAIWSVRYAFTQLDTQHKNTLKTQNEDSKKKTRIELFKDIGILLNQSSSIIREVNIFCLVQKNSNLDMKSEINHDESFALYRKTSQAILAVVCKIESHEIVDLMLFRVFRFAIQSILHDLHKILLSNDRQFFFDRYFELTNDVLMYFGDFQVCMQNMAYGEVFNSVVPYRKPVDKRFKVITNEVENLKELQDYFTKETNWGKEGLKYEKEAEMIFSSYRDSL